MAKLKLKKNIKKRVGDLFICCLVAVIAYCSMVVGEFAYTRYNEYSSRKYISSLVGNKPTIDTKDDGDDPVDDASFYFDNNTYDSLKSVNDDFIGWLHFEGDWISQPIVQGNDNSYYLENSLNRVYNGVGTLFVDCANDISNDQNITIYGHNITYSNAEMFSPLLDLVNEEVYNEHNTFKIYYADHTSEYHIESVFYFDSASDEYVLNIPVTLNIDGYIDFVSEMNLLNTDCSIDPSDKLITLQTCKDLSSYDKLLVVAKEVSNISY